MPEFIFYAIIVMTLVITTKHFNLKIINNFITILVFMFKLKQLLLAQLYTFSLTNSQSIFNYLKI